MISNTSGHAGPKSPALAGLFTKAYVEDFAAIGRAMKGIEVCHARSVLLAMHQLTNSSVKRRGMAQDTGVLVASLAEVGRWAGLSVRKTQDVLRELVAIGRVGTVRSVGATGRFYLRGLMSEDRWRSVAINCRPVSATPAPAAEPTPAHCADVKENRLRNEISFQRPSAIRRMARANPENQSGLLPIAGEQSESECPSRTEVQGQTPSAEPEESTLREAERLIASIRDTAKIEGMLGIADSPEITEEFRTHDREWWSAMAYALAWRSLPANHVRRGKAAAVAVCRMRKILKPGPCRQGDRRGAPADTVSETLGGVNGSAA